jgi:hypothetical protein
MHRIPTIRQEEGAPPVVEVETDTTSGWGQTLVVGINMGTKKDEERRWERTSE